MRDALMSVAQFVRREDGQDLLEYGFLAVLIAVAALAAVSALGGTLNTVLWQPIAQNF